MSDETTTAVPVETMDQPNSNIDVNVPSGEAEDVQKQDEQQQQQNSVNDEQEENNSSPPPPVVVEAVPIEDENNAPIMEGSNKQNNIPEATAEAAVTVDIRTTIRRTVVPYLPPPVIKGIQTIDPVLEPYVGEEASISIITSLLLCFFVVRIVRVLSGLSTGGRAIADEEDDHVLASMRTKNDKGEMVVGMGDDQYSDTVLLCGPPGGGKTRLYYYLAYQQSNFPTVMSIRANMALIKPPADINNSESDDGNKLPIRIIDYPGHASLKDPLFLDILKSSKSNNVRIAVVVDSAKNVSRSAETLYELFQYATNTASNITIFIACHKCDLSTAKNPRRIKIQIRTELEKLLKIKHAILNATTAESTDEQQQGSQQQEQPWWPKGEPLDLDHVKYVTLHFEATSCSENITSTKSKPAMTKLKKYCFTGEII